MVGNQKPKRSILTVLLLIRVEFQSQNEYAYLVKAIQQRQTSKRFQQFCHL